MPSPVSRKLFMVRAEFCVKQRHVIEQKSVQCAVCTFNDAGTCTMGIMYCTTTCMESKIQRTMYNVQYVHVCTLYMYVHVHYSKNMLIS